ncbi:MAG: FG-GAP-like repeat-containing protein, partial [Bacteroidota bacterium]
MAYADFDRDGDIDVIVNNTNMEASLMENTLSDKKSAEANYLRVQLQGNGLNRNGVGAVIRLFYEGQQQVYENTPYRGYLSSIENIAHFGLGKVSKVDSLVVIWPNAQKQVLRNITANQVLTLNIEASNGKENFIRPAVAQNNWFTEITNTSGIHFAASEVDFIDFNIQRLIPHKLTQYGPSLAVADVNGDGLDDIIAGGGSPVYANLFVQNKNGTFLSKSFIDTTDLKYQDDGGICLFDADGDGDLDMYIASGGAENQPGSGHYADHLYINDGKGNFKEAVKALTPNDNSKSAVKAADYDMDGDLDLFIGGRVLPGSYPMPVSSYILRNDSRPGLIRFTDVTKEIAPALQKVGLVCDAAWSDIDNDGWPDLVLAGEWMPISFLKNQKGKFTAVTTTLSTELGWWNSVTAADLDNDGDMDYVVGNFGMNGFLRPSAKFPIKVYGKDFDNNGSFDAIISSYILSTVKGEVKEFPVAGRDEFIRELSGMKEKFPDYALYAKAEMKNIFPEADLQGAVQLSANNFYSSWVENLGNFQFAIHQLPARAQFAPVYGIVVNDFNGDGNMDIILNGNEFSMAPGFGRSDAFNGLVLQGDGMGNFRPLSIIESGIYIPGNGKSLVQLVANNKIILAAARNAGPLNLFQSKPAESKIRKVNPDDRYAIISLKNGKKRKEEFNYGSSFYSQSGRCIQLNNAVQSIEITNSKGQKRIITQ